MGDRATLSKAMNELEDLYLGIPDESVDLTMKDLASYQQTDAERKMMDPIQESPGSYSKTKGLTKVPSLDFARAVEEAREHHRRVEEKLSRNGLARINNVTKPGSRVDTTTQLHEEDVSAYATDRSHIEEREGAPRRRPGIPHSNICALCTEYIYLFRNRCLVCGRVYCRKCVGASMGEMSEGRKCIDCLGRRFSQRYIAEAGQAGCCWRYPTTIKQQELKWAEKGPRRSGERRYRRSRTASRTPSPLGTPARSRAVEIEGGSDSS